MNTHDPAFRRAFRRGKKFFGQITPVFSMVQHKDGEWAAIPFPAGTAITNIHYWNPDGKRWRRFNPEKMNKYINQEART